MLKEPLLKYWDYVRSSFWFVPSLMAAGAAVLAFAAVAFDKAKSSVWLQDIDWAYTGSADGASAVLQTIAGSMITIAGVVFSLTLVALSLASSQFGPRLLNNFMRDRTNQTVLGTFVATFLYCLLVLRTIRFSDDHAFVPHLSVTLGVAFALASLWVLIYFIHHVSVSIQADQIITRVGNDLNRGVERLFPEQIGEESSGDAPDHASDLLDGFERNARPIPSAGDGYVQLIDGDALLELATGRDVLVRLERRPGHYVVRGHAIAMVAPHDRVDADFVERLNAAFGLGHQRTPSQDIEHLILQLVEIATRALSPGVNDPFTAMACIDRLGSGLCRVAHRAMPSRYRCDTRGTLRVLAPPLGFPDLLDAAFNQIRQNSRTNAAVSIRLLETMAVVAGEVRLEDDRAAVRRHADMILRGAQDGLPEPEDRRAVLARHAALVDMLRTSA